MKTPTLISYSAGIEQEFSANTVLRIGYVGSHGYHQMLSLDDNEPTPTVCPGAPCPTNYPANFPAPLAGATIPTGAY